MEKNTEAQPSAQPVDNPTPATWNYPALFWALGISLVIQMLFLPCMCMEGEIKINFAMMFDAFVVIRIVIAWLCKARGRTWLFYAIILYSSPIWITVLIGVLGSFA